MNPKSFLLLGGIVLIVVGVLGFIGVLGPTPDKSIFSSAWWFDNVENWAHLILGIAALVVLYATGEGLQKTITLLVGFLAAITTLSGFFVGTSFLGANLENPLDNILHLVVAVWALWSWWGAKKMMGGMSSGM